MFKGIALKVATREGLFSTDLHPTRATRIKEKCYHNVVRFNWREPILKQERGPPAQKDFHFTKPKNAECIVNADGCQKYTSKVGRTQSAKLQTATFVKKSQLTLSQPTHWLQQKLEERLSGMKFSFVLLVKTNTHLCGLLLPLTPVGTNVWSIPWATPLHVFIRWAGPDGFHRHNHQFSFAVGGHLFLCLFLLGWIVESSCVGDWHLF